MSDIDVIESTSTPVAVDAAVVATAGECLREARLAKGLSIEEVVQALKFSSRQIEAIEADHLEVLQGSVFQRGLVRSYARLLKIDPEPLLALIEARTSVKAPEIRPPENMGNASPKGGIHRIPPLVAVSVLLLIAAGAMIAWHFLGGNALSVSGYVEPTAAQLAPEEVKPLSISPDGQRGVEAPVAVDQPESVVAPAPQPQIADPALPPPGSSVQTIPVVAASAEVSATAAVPSASPGVRRLAFDFRGESWIEVKDASGQVILTGKYFSGNQAVAGRAPFEVVIGNAGVVTMKDEGRSVDLKPYTRAEVARLTLQ